MRGYQERIYLADNAVIGNLEFHLPSFSFTRKKYDELYFLVNSLISAYGANWKSNAAFTKDTWLLGIGPGLRYEISPYLTARLDYGFRIHKPPFANDQIGRLHFSVIAGY